MELSKRLSAVAGLVTEGASVADIGTDHGYIPAYLAKTGRNQNILAMDINKGPLERAASHIQGYGLAGQIQLRQSDGLKQLAPGEAEVMIAAGMGGGLTIQILRDAPEVASSIREFILQPQSEIHKVREYLNHHDFLLIDEEMVEEGGKFYPILKLVHGKETEYSQEELYYGRILLQRRHPVLLAYLQKERRLMQELYKTLGARPGQRSQERRTELEQELARNQRGMDRF